MVTCDSHTVMRKLLEKLHADVSPRDFIKSLIGIFAFIGCDTVSSFAGKANNKSSKFFNAKSRVGFYFLRSMSS